MNPRTIYECNAHFHKKGATHYHDVYGMVRSYSASVGYHYKASALIFRHYFNKEGIEIGYIIPSLMDFKGHGIHYFPEGRVWGIEHYLIPLDMSHKNDWTLDETQV